MMIMPKMSARVLIFSTVAALVVLAGAACGDDDNGGNGNGGEPTSPPATLVEMPTLAPGDEDIPAVAAARAHLLENVDLDPETVEFVSATEVTWSDACLDVSQLTQTPEQCAQVITPGYEVIFQVGQTVYTYHTDQSGRNVRFAGVDIGG